MAFITLNKDKLTQNFHHLDTLFKRNGLDWAVVTKLFCGHKEYLITMLELGIKQVCDSRIDHLKLIRSLAPSVETVFIKPAAKRNARKVVEYADISFNTSFDTIKELSIAAADLGKLHKIVIMVEMGELREGVLPQGLADFYERVFQLPNIEVIGLGTNFTCMFGVLPSYENLIPLLQYKKKIETTFGRSLPILSGGASVTIPLIERDELPAGINHFRVGETLFFGTDVYASTADKKMHQNIFKLYAEIIEIHEKPNIPFGKLGNNLCGELKNIEDDLYPLKSSRAIVDIGLLDIEAKHIRPEDHSIRVAGASSDMTVLDLGENDGEYKVGDKVAFNMDYMGVLRIMNSKYVEKRIETSADRIAKSRQLMSMQN